jgi:arabinan endo-1,5-alpha-L-arabinosidase
VADQARTRRRRRRLLVVISCSVVLLIAAIWTDVDARAQSRHESATLAAANGHLKQLRHQVTATAATRTATATKRSELESYMAVTLGQLASTNSSLNSTKQTAFLLGVNIGTLETCLGGVQSALGDIHGGDNTKAANDISVVSDACTELAGGSDSGLVYPFDFPDPNVILVGQTYYAYATNSVAGNIQIVDSTDLKHWTAVGNALPHLPSWAATGYTWAPSVTRIGGHYNLYYAVDPMGKTTECISVATAGSPQGPFTDTSATPLECQPSLGGSIDPSVFVDTNGTPSLLWKSGGPGTSKIWTQQLDPTGKSFVAGSTPTNILSPDQSWEAGTVEAPDLVAVNGRYLLFYSGNDWGTANYAVGVATCAAPSGPCTDASPTAILSSGDGMAGPGGESIFQDAQGDWWIAFAAWNPGAVGFPNSRGLYVRSLTMTGAVPTVGGPS